VLAALAVSSPTLALLILCGLSENALRRAWQAIQTLDCPLPHTAMAALGKFIGRLGVESRRMTKWLIAARSCQS
jgi:hypothetical protein